MVHDEGLTNSYRNGTVINTRITTILIIGGYHAFATQLKKEIVLSYECQLIIAFFESVLD